MDQLYLLNTSDLAAYDPAEKKVELLSAVNYQVDRPEPSAKFNKIDKCEGIYCEYRYAFKHALIDEKEEINNLY